ncbi:MAG: TIGR04211 family SH3 domain-containing protein [Deltaproteobacteria bacterium]|nr:TIGR04211 family SH3 domain-containing protein [Deltaproteobacteria bacterium]MBW1996203.1 TIGR04211 family SH3 domain-containing protein [Deltaproteobacteria bacterium]MBW2150152.1 TIGR04211 family SH3 domain-containing protein [Deltaproteobacteria bacterium]
MNMKWFVFAGILLMVVSTTALAEQMYVSEIIEITLRTGPGIDHKVIAMVQSGQQLEILKPGNEWTKVRLPNGKEGYVLSRFLTNKKPSELKLRELQQKYQALQAKADSLLEDYNRQKQQNENLLAELASKEELIAKLSKSYETLRQDSAEFLSLKEKYKKASAQLAELTEKTRKYEETLTTLQKRQIFRWVLTGAGILLVGFLIGMSSRRQRRRSSLL